MVAQTESPDSALSALESQVLANLPLIRWLAWRQYCGRNLRRAAVDHEDIVQDIVLVVLKRLHKFDATKYSFATWLSWQASRAGHVHTARIVKSQGDAEVFGSTLTAAGSGRERDRFDTLPDRNAADPSTGAALLRVLVPVVELNSGACPTAYVRDARTGQRVQIPSSDVIVYRDRLFAVAISFDEGDDGLHRVRFANDHTAWVLAAVTG